MLAVHGGPQGEVSRAEFALLFGRYRKEEDGALWFGAALLHDAGDLEDRGDSRSVVHGAVVNGVAIDGASDAEVIEVRGHDDVLFLQLRVRPRQNTRHIGRLENFALHGRAGTQRAHQRKLGQRLFLRDEFQNLIHSVAAAVEELVAAAARDGNRRLLTGGFLQLRIGQQESFLWTAPATRATASASGIGSGIRRSRRRPTPTRGRPRHHDGGGADGAGGLQNRPTLGRGT